MPSTIAWFTGIGSLAMILGVATAQTISKPLPAFQGGSEIPSRPLLMEPRIQKEIGLTIKQRNSLAELEADVDESRQGIMAGVGDEGFDFASMMGGVEEVDRQRRAAIAKVLTPAQKTRLLQIEWQREGWLALGRPDVAAKVKLSQSQTQKIQSIIQAMRQAQTQAILSTTGGTSLPQSPPKAKPNLNPGNGFIDASGTLLPDGGPLNFESDRFRAQADKTNDSVVKISKKTTKEVENLLSLEQKTAFERLLGPTFDFRSLTISPATKTAPDVSPKNRQPLPKKTGKAR